MIRIRNPFNAKIRQHINNRLDHRKVIIIVSIILAIFLIANIFVAVFYRQRFLPGSHIAGQTIGNKTYSSAKNLPILPTELTFKSDDSSKKVNIDSLGIAIDWPKTLENIGKRKSLVPVFGLFGHKNYDAVISYDQSKMQKIVADLAKSFAKDSVNWSIDKSDSEAKLVDGQEGQELEQEKLIAKLRQGLSNAEVKVPIKKIKPDITAVDLESAVKELNAKRQVSLNYTFNGTTRTPTPKDILSWYDISNTKVSLNQTSLTSYINGLGAGLGIRIQNINQLVSSTAKALENQTKLNAAITAAPKAIKNFSYCIRSKNVSQGEMPAFASKVRSTLNDPQGWSLDGQVQFNEVSSGCSMVIWLSAAEDLPGFGAICDSIWSCAVKPNVIINYDRWRYASDAWNANGGSLDGYRTMVINHEAGHWLGFGHRYCGGAGQPAPVMQQQSINLQGCSFNPWPTVAEKNTLKSSLGL